MSREKFTEEVGSAYKRRKEENKMPMELETFTPARLRDYYLNIVSEGERTRDISTLTRIFNPYQRYTSLEKAIKEAGAEKFKPVQSFMNGETVTPEVSTLDLLAMAIDFQPRPYNDWRKIREAEAKKVCKTPTTDDVTKEDKGLSEPEVDPDGKDIEVNKINEPQADNVTDKAPEGEPAQSDNLADTETSSRRKDEDTTKKPNGENTQSPSARETPWMLQKNWRWYVAGISVAGLGLFAYLNSTKNGCMIWADYQYELSSCWARSGRAPIIPYKDSLFKHMTQIRDPKNMTKNDLGSIWYATIQKDSLEFFTSPGYHPLNDKKKLKPLTEYILDKYVWSKKE